MNSQKGFSLLLIILIIVAAVAVVGGGVFVYQQYNSNPNPNPNPNPVACTPNWTCDWGECINGYQSQVAKDLNNCGQPSSTAQIACTALAKVCTTSGQLSIISISPTSGPVGTVVTLTGSEFTSGSATYIGISESGQKSWDPSSVSPSQVKFSIPAGLPIGSHNISVFLAGPQTPTSNSVTFTVTSPTSAKPSITITSPIGRESFYAGQQITLRWNSSNCNYLVGATLLGQNNSQFFLGNWVACSLGSQIVTIPSTVQPGNYKINIASPPESSGPEDTSNNYFTITSQPSITVTSPNGGENWGWGETHSIRWSSNLPQLLGSNLLEANVDIYLCQMTGSIGCQKIADRILDDGSFDWTINSSLTNNTILTGNKNYTIKICKSGEGNFCDSSNGFFSIILASAQTAITSISPASAPAGTDVTVYGNNFAYTNTGAGTSVLLNGQRISPHYINNTSLRFIIPGDFQAGMYNLSVSGSAGVSGTLPFTVLSGPSITVTSPNGGEVWKRGSTYNITWTSTGVNNVSIWIASEGGGGVAEVMNNNFSASIGKFTWTVPTNNIDINAGSNFRVSVSSEENQLLSDRSNNVFTITAP